MKRPPIFLVILIVTVIACRCGEEVTLPGQSSTPTTQAGGPTGRCGDGVCSGPENAVYCPADCAVPTETLSPPTPAQTATKPKANQPAGRCGDGVCDAYEQQNPQVCPQDCEALLTTEPASTVTAALPPTPTPASGRGHRSPGPQVARTVATAAPRLVLACVIGVLIAEPLLLWLFDAEIDQKAFGDKRFRTLVFGYLATRYNNWNVQHFLQSYGCHNSSKHVTRRDAISGEIRYIVNTTTA